MRKLSAPSFFLICLLGFSAAGCIRQEGEYVATRQVSRLGEKNYFVLKNLEGQDIELRTLLKQNKAVLMNFWASWCDPCVEELPDLVRLQEKYEGRPFTILGIDAGESEKRVSAFLRRFPLNYPVVLDRELRVAEIYGVRGIPTTLLVTSEGEVLGVYHAYTPQLVRDVQNIMLENGD